MVLEDRRGIAGWHANLLCLEEGVGMFMAAGGGKVHEGERNKRRKGRQHWEGDRERQTTIEGPREGREVVVDNALCWRWHCQRRHCWLAGGVLGGSREVRRRRGKKSEVSGGEERKKGEKTSF